jgi:hypothetical protein
MQSLVSCLALGIDSGLCCVPIGAMTLSRFNRITLATAFGVCDAVASLIMPTSAHPLPSLPDFPIYLCCAAILGLAARYSRTLLFVLPILLSLDNLVSCGGWEVTLAGGFSSTMLALLGMAAGATFRLRLAQTRTRS